MKITKSIKKTLLSMFGDMKVYKWPLFLVYCPDSFRVKGLHTLEVIDLIQPGDIIQRKYVHYLDGYFIPGSYSHTGVYIGNNKVIHAIAEGVSEINLIDFMRCDAVRILRPVSGQEMAIEKAKALLETPYDFSFKDGEDSLYCHELGAACYSHLKIEKKRPRLFKIEFGKPCYLSESFETEDFELIYEYRGMR